MTHGLVSDTKDSGELPQEMAGPGEVTSVKPSWRRWHLRGALTDGFSFHRQTSVCAHGPSGVT